MKDDPRLPGRTAVRAGLLVLLLGGVSGLGLILLGNEEVVLPADPPARSPSHKLAAIHSADLGRVATRAPDASAGTVASDVRVQDAGPPPLEQAQPATGPPGEAAAAVDGAPVIEIHSTDGEPLHISGAGLDGRAPGRTWPLGRGEHLLRLVGGHRSPPVSLLLTYLPPRLDATIGSADGHVLTVSCRGDPPVAAPLTRPIGVRLPCTATSEGGGRVSFTLTAIGR